MHDAAARAPGDSLTSRERRATLVAGHMPREQSTGYKQQVKNESQMKHHCGILISDGASAEALGQAAYGSHRKNKYDESPLEWRQISPAAGPPLSTRHLPHSEAAGGPTWGNDNVKNNTSNGTFNNVLIYMKRFNYQGNTGGS